MEVALSTRFFDSKILFSLMFDHYEKHLKQELMMCHKYMGFSMTELNRMTVHDRRHYIKLHNQIIEKEKDKYKKLGR